MHLVPFRSLIGRPGNSAHFRHGGKAVVELCDISVGLPWITPGPVDGNTSSAWSVLAGRVVLVVRPWRLEFGAHDCLPFSTASMTIAQGRQVSECSDAWQKKVSPTSDRGESLQARDLFPNWPFGDGHVKRAVMGPEDGISLVPQFMEIRIICPHIHRKLKLADKACATDERGDSSLDSIFRRTPRQRRTVCPSAPDHLPSVHIHCGVPRVHAPNVGTKRAGIPVRIDIRISEGIIALKIGAETWIIFIRSEDKRSPAPPPSHQLGSNPFLLLGCFAMFPEKIAKCAHMLFHL